MAGNDVIAAEVNARLDEVTTEMTVEVREVLFKQLYAQLEMSTNPAQMLLKRISALYHDDEGNISIPEDKLLDRAVLMVVHKLMLAEASLKAIAYSNLSCEHNILYAGEQKSEGNKIFSAQEIAQRQVEQLDSMVVPHSSVPSALANFTDLS